MCFSWVSCNLCFSLIMSAAWDPCTRCRYHMVGVIVREKEWKKPPWWSDLCPSLMCIFSSPEQAPWPSHIQMKREIKLPYKRRKEPHWVAPPLKGFWYKDIYINCLGQFPPLRSASNIISSHHMGLLAWQNETMQRTHLESVSVGMITMLHHDWENRLWSSAPELHHSLESQT